MKIDDSDRPITVANAQKSSCNVGVVILLIPKLMTITNARGENMMTYFRMPGPIKMSCASPLLANSSATMPVSRSEEHTSELQTLMRSSYDVFCLKNKKKRNTTRQ